MKIYNTDKTRELNKNEIDLNKGYLRQDRIFVKHHEAVEAKEAVYMDRSEELSNGSIQIWKELVTPAVEAKEAYDEYEEIQVYALYTAEEKQHLYELKVDSLIRSKYTLSQELSILRQQESKSDEYKAYFAFCEQCKINARKKIYSDES